MLMLIILVPFFSITGMITDRNLLSKFPVCYELVFFSIAVNTLLSLCSDFESIIILLVLFNSVFEALLGLSILVLQDVSVYRYMNYSFVCLL